MILLKFSQPRAVHENVSWEMP